MINTTDRTYNCDNVVFNYVIKHLYRYSSEIERLFDRFESLKSLNHLKIASIGCGPCSELFGIKQFISKNTLEPTFEFIGFDVNQQWNQIQKQIIDIFGEDVQFTSEDVFSYYDQYPDGLPNILILNYVLSDIVKFNRAGVDGFINSLLELFSKMPNSCIIINDISYYERNVASKTTWRALNYMNYIYDILTDNQDVVYRKYKFYFVPQTGSGMTYGVQHTSKQLTSNIINEAHLFDPFIYCGSCQLFIHKTNIK